MALGEKEMTRQPDVQIFFTMLSVTYIHHADNFDSHTCTSFTQQPSHKNYKTTDTHHQSTLQIIEYFFCKISHSEVLEHKVCNIY